MRKLTFSIVIPAHNGERFLREAIESSLAQTRPADEVIVVDDASVDGTAEIVQSCQWSGRMAYYFNEHATGYVDAWNRAVQKSNGDFVSILHQDDLLAPEYLENIEKALVKHTHVKHIYSACYYINDQGSIIGRPPKPYSLKPVLYSGKEYAKNYLDGVIGNKHIHRCPGVTTSRDLLIHQCSYRKEAGHIADDDFFYRVGAFTDVIGISYPLASFRDHSASVTQKLDSLTLTLTKDYVFQVKDYKESDTILDSSDIAKLNRQAIRFVNLLLFQSLLYDKREWVAEAFRLKEELNRLLPGLIEKDSPLWARIMWKNMKQRESNIRITLYVKTLHAAINMRDRIKAYLFS